MSREDGVLAWPERAIPYVLKRSRKRRRTLALVVTREGKLMIHVPYRTAVPQIQHFITARRDWILQKLQLSQQKFEQTKICQFRAGDEIFYLGHRCQLTIIHDTAQRQGCVLRPHHLIVNIHNATQSADGLQAEIRFEVKRWYKRRAQILFTRRLDIFAKRLGVQYRQCRISNAVLRWGSCSVDGVIRLNWRLLACPRTQIDYVAVHELCHISHKNHGRRFWNLVATQIPNWKALRLALNRNHYTAALQGLS